MDRDIAVALLDQLHAAQNEFYGGAVTPCCATFWHLQVVSMPRTSVGARFTNCRMGLEQVRPSEACEADKAEIYAGRNWSGPFAA